MAAQYPTVNSSFFLPLTTSSDILVPTATIHRRSIVDVNQFVNVFYNLIRIAEKAEPR